MYFEALASGGDDWYNIVLITAPEGASVTFDDGDEEVIITGTGMQYPVPLHNDSSTYSITVNANGFVKTDSVTTSATSGEVFTKIIKYAKITLTFDDAFRGQNFNITDGSISPSTQQVFPSTGNTIDLYVPNTGTWKTSSSAAGESYESKGVTVVDIDGSYVDELHTRPDGKTVTPTDVIQTWLECAGIRNKDYTTLEEVLADKETLQTLISDENAVDYMVRSKSWITSNGLVPIMTSMTTPKGEVIESGHYSTQIGYLAFDGNDTTGWSNTNGVPQGWLGYTFTSPQIVKFVSFKATRIATFTIQGSNDGFVSDTHELTSVISTGATGDTAFTYDVDLSSNTTAYESYRINILTTTQYEPKIHTLQFYSRTDDGITDDPTAMRYIGLRNYASDTLLDDADWCEAIVNSTYFESVLNAKVPTMTGYTTPSGEVANMGDESYPAWKAFDGTTSMVYVPVTKRYDPFYYKFTSNIRCVVAVVGGYPLESNVKLSKFKIQASTDNSTWADLSPEITNTAKSTGDKQKIILNNSNEYLYYAMTATQTSAGGYEIETLQFYGREDVDESVIHIYSAASDNDIHYLSGSTPVTVASTDTDGHGTIARTLLPAGTYDLYSSVAMDPDGDLSTEYFHKEVMVKADTIAIDLMPDNALYWYGYEDANLEDMSAANGWSASQQIWSPNRTTHYISLNPNNGNVIIGISSTHKVSGDFHTIYQVTRNYPISPYSGGDLASRSSKLWSAITANSILTSTNLAHATLVGQTDNYLTIGAQDERAVNCYALWYE